MGESAATAATPSREGVTQLLIAYRDGDREAFDRLVPMVYDDLRRIARRQLRRGRPGHTLDTTGLDALEQLHKAVQRRGGRMQITGLQPQPASLMQRSGFADRLAGANGAGR